ncbi:hypothetical protein [uncultured Hyphomicrobium sp.]|uniref:hypothetical protein n=1 Tax=uncultured Hyphomicrobium sp. TaxID=194373 RepID=UPI0025FC36DF|nr:hypothetical protein [uncultured Hyphomicrobium sp.]
MGAMRFALGALGLAVCVALVTPVSAGWLSRIAREAAEGGGGVASKSGKSGLGALDNAAVHVAGLPKVTGGTALAAHVTPEGHWKFANREGQVFTAATPEELARVGAALAPEAAPGGRLAYYLSEDAVFSQRAALKDLPRDADLHVVVGDEAFKLRRVGADELAAEFRPNIVLSLADRALFDETVYRLTRSLNRSNIRTLALETGGPQRLSSAPRFDPATKAALVDQVDPSALPAALSGLKGQTAMISGRIEGNVLTFRSTSGPEQSLDIVKLVKAAEDADVNLLLLSTGASRQPGGRNWLWQTVEVAGLDEALKRANFADFLSALGGAGSELTIKAAPSSHGRIVISALPTPAPSAPITDTVGSWIGWDSWLGEVTGHVAVKSIEVFARDQEREKELDARILPGIPSGIQFAYLGSIVAGLIAWQVTFSWWKSIWPPEQRQDYAGRLGYAAARLARFLACLLVFLPLAGIPALLWLGVQQLWNMITSPIRAVRWLWDRLRPARV